MYLQCTLVYLSHLRWCVLCSLCCVLVMCLTVFGPVRDRQARKAAAAAAAAVAPPSRAGDDQGMRTCELCGFHGSAQVFVRSGRFCSMRCCRAYSSQFRYPGSTQGTRTAQTSGQTSRPSKSAVPPRPHPQAIGPDGRPLIAGPRPVGRPRKYQRPVCDGCVNIVDSTAELQTRKPFTSTRWHLFYEPLGGGQCPYFSTIPVTQDNHLFL